MSLVPYGNMNEGSGSAPLSFIAFDRIAEERAKTDAEYRSVAAACPQQAHRLERLAPYEGKLSRTVLRRVRAG